MIDMDHIYSTFTHYSLVTIPIDGSVPGDSVSDGSVPDVSASCDDCVAMVYNRTLV